MFDWTLIDSLELLVIFGPILFFGAAAVISATRVAPEMRIRVISPGALSPEQEALFEPYSREIWDLGYQHVADFSVETIPQENLSRVFKKAETETWAICSALLQKQTDTQAASAIRWLELDTLFEDETMLITRNVEMSSVLDPAPGSKIVEARSLKRAQDLDRRHRAELAKRQTPARSVREEEFFPLYKEHYRRTIQHQVERGLLRWDEEAQVFRATRKLAWRGIRNYLNPLADNFTPLRFVLGLLSGLALPYLVLSYVPEALGFIDEEPKAFLVLTAATLALSNLALGAIWKSKILIWGFIMGSLAARLALPQDFYEESEPLVVLAMFWLVAIPGSRLADRMAARLA